MSIEADGLEEVQGYVDRWWPVIGRYNAERFPVRARWMMKGPRDGTREWNPDHRFIVFEVDFRPKDRAGFCLRAAQTVDQTAFGQQGEMEHVVTMVLEQLFYAIEDHIRQLGVDVLEGRKQLPAPPQMSSDFRF